MVMMNLEPVRPESEAVPINAGLYLPGNWADQTATLNALADEARATNRGLFIPDGIRIVIEGEVNFRGILNLEVQASLLVGAEGLVIVGNSSRHKEGQKIDIRRIAYRAGSQTNVALKTIGAMQSIIRVGACPRWEFVADRNDPDGGAISYTTVFPGLIDRLEFRSIDHATDTDASPAWITECLFIGGDIRHITTTSDSFRPSSITFFKSCVEGGTIDLDYAIKWRFLDCRFEYGTKVRFGLNAYRCLIEDSFGGGLLSFAPSCEVVEDLGRDNVVRSTVDDVYNRHVLWGLDEESQVRDGTAVVEANGVAGGIGKLSVEPDTTVADTGLIPIEGAGMSAEGAHATQWRMPRFAFSSDAEGWRPEWRFYDEDKKQLVSADFAGVGSLSLSPFWWRSGDYIGTPEDVSFSIVNALPGVRYVRCTIKSGSTPPPFTRVELIGFTLGPSSEYPVGMVRRRMARTPMSQTNPPMGAGTPGTSVDTIGGRAVSVEQRKTTVDGDAPAGNMLTVSSSTGIAIGDVLGVVTSSGRTHWSKISGIDGRGLTLVSPLPENVAADAQVVVTRWR